MSRESNAGRVGPNAVIRVYESLRESKGQAVVNRVFEQAGLARYLERLPSEMVDEAEVAALQAALRAELGVSEARPIARDAGRRTGDYLLANRIPKPAQAILKILPAKLASRTLLKAIRGNAWTFVGTGVFDAEPTCPARITIRNSLLCRDAQSDEPLCDFYAGTFERLFRELVSATAVATETACSAQGAECCVFEIRW